VDGQMALITEAIFPT